MLNVFLTIDTEVWQDYADLTQNIETAVYGITNNGECGLRFQIERFNAYGLKACFFVEPLFSYVAGTEPLHEIVAEIQDAGHDVQLHIHTEWLSRMPEPILQGTFGQSIKDFSKDQQTLLLRYALKRLQDCGAENVCAFRAGNYGANFDTLRALSENGILYDTSHNTCYLDTECEMKTPNLLLQPRIFNGVYEFPVNFFCDWPGHYRHLQLTACSVQELKNALLQAYELGWFSIVIVLHSFELLHRQRANSVRPSGADRIMLRRFDKLCCFLADNQDKFRTTTFSELDMETIPSLHPPAPLRSNIFYTAFRYAQQIVRRFDRHLNKELSGYNPISHYHKYYNNAQTSDTLSKIQYMVEK